MRNAKLEIAIKLRFIAIWLLTFGRAAVVRGRNHLVRLSSVRRQGNA